jgi:hypothetical protein
MPGNCWKSQNIPKKLKGKAKKMLGPWVQIFYSIRFSQSPQQSLSLIVHAILTLGLKVYAYFP